MNIKVSEKSSNTVTDMQSGDEAVEKIQNVENCQNHKSHVKLKILQIKINQ